LFRREANGDIRKGCRRPTGTSGKAMVMTKERLFPWKKVCYGDFGRDGAGPSTCGHDASGGGCRLGDSLAVSRKGDAKSN
jgi:hypothetical protein